MNMSQEKTIASQVVPPSDGQIHKTNQGKDTSSSSTQTVEPTTTGPVGSRQVPLRRRLNALVPHIPTVIVLVGMVGIGYWGHHHGWKMPKFSELSGNAPEARANWCEPHGVPEEICIACNAGLMPKGELRGWCSEHGVAECVLHHPTTAQLAAIPEISRADLDQAAYVLSLRPRPKNNRSCQLHLRRIQFAHHDAVEKAGIDIRLAEISPVVEAIVANGEITYDPTRVARVTSRTPGTIWRVSKNIGDQVAVGDLLALVDSPAVGRLKSELLQATAELKLANQAHTRLSGLGGIVPGRRLQEIEAAQAKANAVVVSSMQGLINLGLPLSPAELLKKSGPELSRDIQLLGLPSELVSGFDPNHTPGNLVPLVAPRDGIIVQRDVVDGDVVDASKTLFTVVDTRRMWLMLDVPMEDARYVRIGQKVLFRPDGYTDHYTGIVTWTSTEMDKQTRTVSLRAELANEDRQLLSETFGRGQVILRQTPRATVVPQASVHWEGCCHVVFVRDKNFNQQDAFKVFHTRMVRPGVTQAGFTELVAGVLPGEVLVTKGSGVLRAELLKGNLGAG